MCTTVVETRNPKKPSNTLNTTKELKLKASALKTKTSAIKHRRSPMLLTINILTIL
jgi:hypothetical protein